MSRSHRAAIIAGLASLAIVSAACSSSGGQSPSAAASAGGAVTTPAASAGGAAPTELNLLTWEGYADPEWVGPFEKANNVKVNATLVGSDDEEFTKLKAGAGTTYDLVTGSRTNMPGFFKEGSIVALDKSKLPAFDTITPALVPLVPSVDGNLLAVPYVTDSIAMMYVKSAFPTPPDSWDLIFGGNPATCGKIILQDDAGTAITLAAMYLGYKDPYKLDDTQLAAVKDLLIKTKPCIKAFYTGSGDAANYFASGAATIGLSNGSLIAKQATDAGAPTEIVVPKEGALGWMDTWAITKGGAANKSDLAYKWLNYIQSPEVQAMVAKKTSYAPTVAGATALLDPELIKTLHLDDPSYLSKLAPFGSPEAPDSWEKRLEIWNTVKSS